MLRTLTGDPAVAEKADWRVIPERSLITWAFAGRNGPGASFSIGPSDRGPGVTALAGFLAPSRRPWRVWP